MTSVVGEMHDSGVGAALKRFDATDKVTGAAEYPADRIPADALWAKVVFTGQPHARLIALDTSDAEASPGVVAVLTAADVPVNEYGLTKNDQPVFIGTTQNDRTEVPSNISRWEADHLALVVAETAEQAEAGAALVKADWEQLEVLGDIDAALSSDTLIHPEDGLDSNRYHSFKIRKGDLAKGQAATTWVVEGTYELPYQEHAYLQPEAGLAYYDSDRRLTVEVAGQWTHEDRVQLAHALDLPEDRLRVIYPSIGGAFGGREDISLQIVLALAAMRLAEKGDTRAVGSIWSREESIVGHHKRHRGRIEATLGADADGKITFVEADVVLDAGAYNYTSNKVLGNAHIGVAGCYEVPNARIDSSVVYTNATPGGAFRGFGGPQAAFVAETQMNKLAELSGLDPIELRRINTLKNGSEFITQTEMPEGVSLPQVIDRCAIEARMGEPMRLASQFSPVASLAPAADALKRGRGFACAFKNVGFSFGFPERCEAEIHLLGGEEDEYPTSAILFHAGAEVGQGAHQAFIQMAAEATGVGSENIEGVFSDTASSGDSGSASASRLTWMAGNSIQGAASEAEKQWREGARPAIGQFRFVPPPTEYLDPETGAGWPNFTYGYVAQAIEMTVDTETGHIVVDRVVSTHDVGKAINPVLVEGQIEGAVIQAHGYALSENLQSKDGFLLNPRFSGYLIPGIGDIPRKVESVIMEEADPLGPFGARGMAEMPMMTYAPALVAALHDATGVWFDTFPLTPSRVLAGLKRVTG